MSEEWRATFDKFHCCDKPSNIKIFHRNGCGPTPQACGNNLHDDKSQIYDPEIVMGGLWSLLSDLPSSWKSSGTNLNKFQFLLNDAVVLNCVIQAKDYCVGVRELRVPLD